MLVEAVEVEVMEYQTRIRLLGLPLVHVTTGRLVAGAYRRGIAKGWVAIGDVSVGVLVSIGGVAVGGVCVGGLAAGLLPVVMARRRSGPA